MWMRWQNCRRKKSHKKVRNLAENFCEVFYFVQYTKKIMYIYKKNADEHPFVDNGENLGGLSTCKTPRTQLFHKVVHIIHNFRGKVSGKNGEQMCFLWKSEKPENKPFYFLRKNYGYYFC